MGMNVTILSKHTAVLSLCALLDPSESVRVHVHTNCGVPFLAHEEVPDREGVPIYRTSYELRPCR
jgi:hypothetical protein